MPKNKYDGVIEAVHYHPDGSIKWVRGYLRRGSVFSDRLLMDRQTLIDHLKAGKVLLSGQRVTLMGGTFKVGQPLRLVQKNNQEIVVTDDHPSSKDHLQDIPII